MRALFLAMIYFSLAMVVSRSYFILRKLQHARPQSEKKLLVNNGSFQPKHGDIKWESSSLQRISPAAVNAFYPRMVQLPDESLLLAYASKGNIVVQKCLTGTGQWQEGIVAAAQVEGINMDTPELLQLQNGEILLCYNGRPQGALRKLPEAGKRFDIRIKRSSDAGTSWKDEKILYQAGTSFKDGCWEPAAIQLPSGEIQLYFSDEGIYTESNEQNISMLRSADNAASWSARPVIISFRKNSRDGMPVPQWLPKQQRVAMAIEDPGIKNFKPAIIHSNAMGQWTAIDKDVESLRVPALAEKLADTVYAGAPYLRRFSNGITVLSYQSSENRAGKNTEADAVMVVATGNDAAEAFQHSSIPFAVPEGFHALWNSVCITRGDTIIALTSTNAFSKSASEIWMIKGTLQ